MAKETSQPGLSPKDRAHMQPDFSFGLSQDDLHDLYENGTTVGEMGALSAGDSILIHDTLFPPKPEELKMPGSDALEKLLEKRPSIDPRQFLPTLKAAIKFEERDPNMHLTPRDVLNFVFHHGDGKNESYQDRLNQAEARGQKEAASYGIGEIDGEKFVMFSTHFEFMGGTLSDEVGERFVRAITLARKEKVPFLATYASGGARMQENTIALDQMSIMATEIAQFKEETNLPVVSLLIGKTYGGISASPVPLADVLGAMEGTDFGFSGPDVIEAYEMKPIPKGSQSCEANFMDRNIDVLFKTQDEFLAWWGNLVSLKSEKHNKKLTPADFSVTRAIKKIADSIRFPFGEPHFFNILRQELNGEVEEDLERKTVDPKARTVYTSEHIRQLPKTNEEIYQQFQTLSRDAKRFDTEYLMRILEKPVPLYNGYATENFVGYPPIIASIGKVGTEPVMVIGQQHSYYKVGERVGKIPASPTPYDFEYQMRMMELAERLGLPVIFHVDTLGAKPTIRAEQDGQSAKIARILAKGNRLKTIATTFISSLGSGGGLALNPRVERRHIFEDATAAVAEPRSSSAILAKTPTPSIELEAAALVDMKTTAYDQQRLGLTDVMIPIIDGEVVKEPQRVVRKVSLAIQQFLIDYSEKNGDPKAVYQYRKGRMRREVEKYRASKHAL